MPESRFSRGVQGLASFVQAAQSGAGPFDYAARARYPAKGSDGTTPIPVTPPLSHVTDPADVQAQLDLIANPTAGNKLTPQVILGSGARAADINLYTVTGGVWIPVTIDRPEIWIPQGFCEAPIWYSPNLVPKVSSSVGDLQKSTRFGVVYLSSPGTWWLRYTVSPVVAGASIAMLRIDAWQPGVVARYLGEAGNHNCVSTIAANPTTGTPPGQIVAPTVNLLPDASLAIVSPANRDRTGITIQNNSVVFGGGSDGRILITHSSDLGIASKNPIAAGAFGGPRGTVLQVGATITFSGDTNVKGNILAKAYNTTTSSNMYGLQLDILEYT